MRHIDFLHAAAKAKDARLRREYHCMWYDPHGPFTLIVSSQRTICISCSTERHATIPWWKRCMMRSTMVEFPCEVVRNRQQQTAATKGDV